eukprot:RCo016013
MVGVRGRMCVAVPYSRRRAGRESGRSKSECKLRVAIDVIAVHWGGGAKSKAGVADVHKDNGGQSRPCCIIIFPSCSVTLFSLSFSAPVCGVVRVKHQPRASILGSHIHGELPQRVPQWHPRERLRGDRGDDGVLGLLRVRGHLLARKCLGAVHDGMNNRFRRGGGVQEAPVTRFGQPHYVDLVPLLLTKRSNLPASDDPILLPQNHSGPGRKGLRPQRAAVPPQVAVQKARDPQLPPHEVPRERRQGTLWGAVQEVVAGRRQAQQDGHRVQKHRPLYHPGAGLEQPGDGAGAHAVGGEHCGGAVVAGQHGLHRGGELGD